MLTLRGELHIHSVLSPCASLDMGPKSIVKRAKEKGLDFIGITDHNSTKNLPAFELICAQNNLKLIYGVEVETKEEVHVLCYFNALKEAQKFGEKLFQTLKPIKNDPEIFGYQVIVNHQEDILAFEERLLLQRSSMGLVLLEEEVKKNNGVLIPAHIDREKNGLLRILGFLPPEPVFPILEVSKNCEIAVLKNKYKFTESTIFKGCDAHNLEEIGNQPITIMVEKFSLEELVMAFKGINKRSWFQ